MIFGRWKQIIWIDNGCNCPPDPAKLPLKVPGLLQVTLGPGMPLATICDTRWVPLIVRRSMWFRAKTRHQFTMINGDLKHAFLHHIDIYYLRLMNTYPLLWIGSMRRISSLTTEGPECRAVDRPPSFDFACQRLSQSETSSRRFVSKSWNQVEH